MAGARLLSAPDRHRIPAPLQIPTKTLKGEKIFSISDKDFPVTPVYFAHVLLTRMGLLKLLICHFTYFHAGGPREISRGPPVPGRHRPLFFSRFFCWRRRNRSSSDWRRRCRRSRRSRSPACSRSLARACWAQRWSARWRRWILSTCPVDFSLPQNKRPAWGIPGGPLLRYS